jgi:hypothetical protein
MMNAFISGKHRLTRLPALVLGTFSLVLVACAQKSGENGAQTPVPNVASTIAAVEPAALPDSAPAP